MTLKLNLEQPVEADAEKSFNSLTKLYWRPTEWEVKEEGGEHLLGLVLKHVSGMEEKVIESKYPTLMKYQMFPPPGSPIISYLGTVNFEQTGAGKCLMKWSSEVEVTPGQEGPVGDMVTGLIKKGLEAFSQDINK